MNEKADVALFGVPNISVVIPVFNTDDYLGRCIESVLSQTMREIEVIIVDDGSTDRSGEIADEYATRDSRVRVLHKRNEGLSEARNDGVAIAEANYIMFVDSDDYIDPQFCEKPYRAAVEHKADLVYFMHRRMFSNGKVETTTTSFPDGVITEAEALYINNHVAVTAWSLLYDKKLLEGHRFPAGRLCEDVGVTHRVIHEASRVCLINEPLYNYTCGRDGSLWNTAGEKLSVDAYDMGRLRIDDLESWGYDARYEKQLLALYYLASEGRAGQRGDVCHKLAKESGAPSTDLVRMQRWMLRLYRLSPTAFDLVCNVAGLRRKN